MTNQDECTPSVTIPTKVKIKTLFHCLWHYYIFMTWAPIFLNFLAMPLPADCVYEPKIMRCIVQAPWNSYFIIRNEPRTFCFCRFFLNSVVVWFKQTRNTKLMYWNHLNQHHNDEVNLIVQMQTCSCCRWLTTNFHWRKTTIYLNIKMRNSYLYRLYVFFVHPCVQRINFNDVTK